MDATHIPGLEREEPDLWSEDDIPTSDAEERERRLASDDPPKDERRRENPRE